MFIKIVKEIEGLPFGEHEVNEVYSCDKVEWTFGHNFIEKQKESIYTVTITMYPSTFAVQLPVPFVLNDNGEKLFIRNDSLRVYLMNDEGKTIERIV